MVSFLPFMLKKPNKKMGLENKNKKMQTEVMIILMAKITEELQR